MPNQFLPAVFVENVKRLALGIEPLDGGRGGRIAYPLSVTVPRALLGLPAPKVDHHDSCLRAVLYQPGVDTTIELRFHDPARRHVPRQIRYPILTVAQAEALEYRNRVRRPVLFPGAAFDTVSLSTGVRGTVTRGGRLARWSRIEARPPGSLITDPPLALAHGDDRGEFLLLVPAAATAGEDLTDPLPLRIDVFLPAVVPAPSSPGLAALDPFWDLPVEIAPVLNPADPALDPVSAGDVRPSGYSATIGRTVDIPVGTISSERTPFAIP